MSAEASRDLMGGERQPPQRVVLGSRGSDLARAQTAMVTTALQNAWPALEVSSKVIKTTGDERSAEPILSEAGRKGLFTGEIERVLLGGEIDVAVHSAKDLPSEATPGLELWSVLPRGMVDDVLIQRVPGGLQSLGPDSVVATGSVHRQHQLRCKHPRIKLVDLRGNVPTRLRKLVTNGWNGIVLARAGVERLGYEISAGRFDFEGASLYAEILPFEDFLPAGGQGVIVMQLRSNDEKAKEIVSRINHLETLLCLRAEREFLRLLAGDCSSPVGVLGTIEHDRLTLRAQVFKEGDEALKAATVHSKVCMKEVPQLSTSPEAVSRALYSTMYGQG